MGYEEIPYASEQGIFCGHNRELNRAIREFSHPDQRILILGRRLAFAR
jgi:hypothetical protein